MNVHRVINLKKQYRKQVDEGLRMLQRQEQTLLDEDKATKTLVEVTTNRGTEQLRDLYPDLTKSRVQVT